MYRCEICATVCSPGEKLKKYVIYRTVRREPPPRPRQTYQPPRRFGGMRPEDLAGETIPKKQTSETRKEIEAEVQVCRECMALLETGISLATLMSQNHHKRVEAADVAEAPKPAPPPPPKKGKALLLGKE